MKKKTRQLLILNGLLILIVAAAILSVNSGYEIGRASCRERV